MTSLAPPLDFTLPDQDGQPFPFDRAYRARRNTVLVFYRGRW